MKNTQNAIRSRTWIEISRKNLLSNLSGFKKLVGKNVKVACVIKANAYGHGLLEVASILKDKADMFAVDSLQEAMTLKASGVKKEILILGYIPISDLENAIQNGFSFVLYNFESLQKIFSLSVKKVAKVHLKIETGLNRQGIKISDLKKFVDIIKDNLDKLKIEGIYTHFANIEGTLDPSFTKLQIASLKKTLGILKTNGLSPKYTHIAATAATILYPETHFNLVRVGIGLYGLLPSRETRIIDLKPVLSWKSIVAQTKTIKKGETVSYGRTWTASKDSKIAVIPVGYSDGFDRKLSNVGKVLIKGKYAPVIGRVAMDMFMVDISEIGGVSLEDEVVIIGQMGKLSISVEEIAEKVGTIQYEIVARINPNLPRIVR